MAVTPALGKLKQMDYFEFEAKLGYKVSARPARTTELCQKQNIKIRCRVRRPRRH